MFHLGKQQGILIGTRGWDIPVPMLSPVPVVCPVCSEALVRSGRSYACINRHNFDLSKEGYLSLLHGQGNYQQIGDDKQMMEARVRVHRLPAYEGLAKAISSHSPESNTSQGILDIGCGDAFFLDHLARAAGGACTGVGVDISKSALAKAAKAYPGLFFVRTDAAHDKLPFADASFGLVLSIFAPRPIEEVTRVLKADGAWLIVTATQDHMKEVREFIPLAAIGTGKLDAPTSQSYVVLKSGVFEHEALVAHDDLVSVIEMSPSIHRLRREFGEKWGDRVPQDLKVTFSFSITLLGRQER